MNKPHFPKKISPDPVIDAIVELRFQSELPKQAIYGIIYEQFREDYPEQAELPIVQISEKIRLQDPSLKYKAWYSMSGNDSILRIGPDVLAISARCENGYPGWNKYGNSVKMAIEKFTGLKIAKSYIRIGVRYINFFPKHDIFDSIRLSITCDGMPFLEGPSRLTTTKQTDDVAVRVIVDNGAVIQENQNQESSNGSVLDLDACVGADRIEEDKLFPAIDKAHSAEKEQFFKLLKADFLESLNPTY